MITPGTAPSRELHYFPYSAAVTEQAGQAMALLSTSTLFDDAQRATLAAFCDSIVPSLAPPGENGAGDPTGFWARSASHLGVPEALEVGLLMAELPDDVAAGLRELLDGLAEQGMNAGTPQELREQIVVGVENSGPEALAGIATLRGLCLSLFYALPDLGTGRNPNWDAIGYPGPIAPPRPIEKPIALRTPQSGELTIDADVCVIGSGAGGGVIAGELAGRGKAVCVLEAGGYFNESDFNGLELPAYQNMYLNGGPFLTAEGQVSILSGTGLGGGTVVNWTNCLRTHGWVREQWAREHGLEGLDGADYDADMDAVLERLQANDACSDLNGVHHRLKEGCEALGYDFRLTVRNTDPDSYDPATAGYMGFGDVSGSKQSTAKTYLEDAHANGGQFVTGCKADRILVEGGRAAGVEATWTGPDGSTARVLVRAPTVVVACGSIESPALLLRSGIGGPAVGDYLRLHPTTAISGFYGEDQRWSWGPPQAALSHEFADLEDGYGFLLECSQATTGLVGAATAWTSGREHKELMLDWTKIAGFINLTRDRGHGRITIDGSGNPVVSYLLTDELDQHNFRRGLAEMIKLHDAAGAERIATMARGSRIWNRGEDIDKFIAEISSASLAPRDHAIFSAHQMGSCRMGSNPETSVADPWGELHDTKGVWIGDASAFPTSSGTNPMITIMSLARRTSGAIAAR